MDVDLCLEAKEEEVGLRKLKNIVDIQPSRSHNGNCRVKSRNGYLEDTPEVIVAIVGFVANGVKHQIDLGGKATKNQQRQKLYITFAHSCVFDQAQPWGAETLQTV
jgi:hypothetical protein